jgi:hypothetical protein
MCLYPSAVKWIPSPLDTFLSSESRSPIVAVVEIEVTQHVSMTLKLLTP